MVGKIVLDESGNPVDGNGVALSLSKYQPSKDVMDLFARVQTDYQTNYALQHREFDEFDGMSLLNRTRLDQQTFGAFVGCEYVPQHKKWRWKGRKNTSRNKLIGILAHMIAGMLFPYVHATNDRDEEDKDTAKVMSILIEDHLKKAGYEMKFLYMVLSALVNPAVFVEVEYVEAMQTIKQRLATGKIKIIEAVDELLSGLQLHIIPVDEILLGDFYTNPIQAQPNILRVRRISYDVARKENGDHKDFQYVQAGTTRILIAGQENQTLYDIEWTEADANFVQEITMRYRGDDLEVKWVGGVFMGNEEDIYNNNPFTHRRMTQITPTEWASIPVYPFAKSFFEPIDPSGRFAYGKSGAFKEYWDDKSLNTMHQLAHDGTYLDVFKPMFLSGVANVNSIVIAPGATTGMPQGSSATPYQLGPNIIAALNMMRKEEEDISLSTQDNASSGQANKNVTAYATDKAIENAKVILGVFGLMIGDLVTQIGELSMDCIIENTTVGEIDATVPEALAMKFKTITAKGKEKGAKVTNRIIFTDALIGKKMTQDQVRKREWDLYKKAGGDSDQRLWEVNPYRFARTRYGMSMDVDKMIDRSVGADKRKKLEAFNVLTDPRVAPYTDQEAVIDDFVIDVFADGDPERYKKKGNPTQDMLGAVMGQSGQNPNPTGAAPVDNAGGGKVVPQQNAVLA